MAEREDYLWDGTGSDPEVERLEELFGELRVAAVPPALPARRPRGVWIAAAAVLIVGLTAVGLEVRDQRDRGADGSETAARDGAPITVTQEKAAAPRTDPPPAREAKAPSRVAVAPAEDVLFVAGPIAFDDDPSPTGLSYDEQGVIYSAPGTRLQSPRLSADGARVSFEVHHLANRRVELWGADLVETNVVGLTRKADIGQGLSDTRNEALAWDHKRPSRHAWVVSGPGHPAIHLSSGEVIATPGGANKDPSWDPSSSRFVFSSGRTGNGDLYLWDDGTQLQLTYDNRKTELYPRFTPDGETVVYVRAGGGSSDIMMMDVLRFTSLPLVEWEDADCSRPSPSPDSQEAVFVSNQGTASAQDFDLWLTDLRPGAEPRRLGGPVHVPAAGGFTWTPDGKHVAAAMADPSTDCIALIATDGSGAECLELDTEINREPHLSPTQDGLLLAWTSLRGSARQLNIARLEFD